MSHYGLAVNKCTFVDVVSRIFGYFIYRVTKKCFIRIPWLYKN